MSTSSNATSSSQDYSHTHITNILCVIRRANERYAQVAAALRHSLRPTYHARKRAQSLRLRVSIDLALKLDPKQISTVPLPIIEVVTPFPQEAPRTRPTLRCDIPQNVDQEGSLSSVSVYSKPSPDGLVSSTDLLASRWSLTTLGSDVGDQLPEEEITSSSDCDEVKGITVVGAQDTRRPVLCRSNDQGSVHLDVPIDANRFSWSSYLSDGLATDSSSSDSSGPETPESHEHQLLSSMICVKRKAKGGDDIESIDIPEKRPKYARKSWVNASSKRILIKMTSIRKH